MNNSIPLYLLDEHLQKKLVNTVNSPLDKETRVLGMNAIIQFLQSVANWDSTKRTKTFTYDTDTNNYNVEDTLLITDLKDIKTIRDTVNAYVRFNNCDEELIDQYLREHRTTNVYAVEEIDNEKILKIIYGKDATLEIVYFSDFMVLNGTVWQLEFTTSTLDNNEELLIPQRHRDGFLSLVAEYLFRQMKDTSTDQSYIFEQLRGSKELALMMNDFGNEIVRDTPSVMPNGTFSERNDNYNQWD
jgi:hypothetical protein